MLVSIGIPTYNRPEGLRKTLECLTRQTYQNLEIIISDNCSQNFGVQQVVYEFIQLDNRIEFHTQTENKGPAFNFKFVLNKAKGDYFMWAADDDWWDPKFVENIVMLIQASPGAVAGFCNYTIVNEQNVQLHYPNSLPYLLNISHQSDYTRLSSFINQYEGYGKSNLFYSIVRTDILKSIPFDLTNKKVPLGGDLSIIYSWLRFGNIVIANEVLRKTTIGNVKQNSQFITEFDQKKWTLIFIIVYSGKMNFYWNTWKDNLFFYFYLTRTAPLNFFVKTLLYFTITKKILLFCYDLMCYNVVLRGFNIFKYLKRKESLVQ
jgi:glycosyltransferase involved in cell wall biosynthesis